MRFGETPWDEMSRDGLLRLVQKQHSALITCASILHMSRAINPDSTFWTSAQGTGFQALAKADSCLSDTDHEEIYRMFFRYADDLLFSPALGGNWMVCPEGHFIGSYDVAPYICSIHHVAVRPLEWSDLSPKCPED